MFLCAIPSSKSRSPPAPVAYDRLSPNQPPPLSTLLTSQSTNLQLTSLRSWMFMIRHRLRTLGIPQAPVHRPLLILAAAFPTAPMPVLQLLLPAQFLPQFHMFRFLAIIDADILVLRQPPGAPRFPPLLLRTFQLPRRLQRHPFSRWSLLVHFV